MARKKPTLSKSAQLERCASEPAGKVDSACCNPAQAKQSPKSASKPPIPDEIEIASMDSFPCSDPPGYYSTCS